MNYKLSLQLLGIAGAIMIMTALFCLTTDRLAQAHMGEYSNRYPAFRFPPDPFEGGEFDPYKTKSKRARHIWFNMNRHNRQEYCDYLMILWLETELAKTKYGTGDDQV